MTSFQSNAPNNQQIYTRGSGIAGSDPFIPVFETRDPNQFDANYPVKKQWINISDPKLWILKDFSNATGETLANWILIAAGQGIESVTGDDGVIVTADANNNINFLGETVANATNVKPLYSKNTAANTETYQVQVSTTTAISDINNAGLSSYNEDQFNVDANGFVNLKGGTTPPILKINVDDSTPPGTNPVVADSDGEITVTGNQIAAETTPNAIKINSLLPNTYSVEIQRSIAKASSTIGSNGICHFDSSIFNVNSDGFVTISSGSPLTTINTQIFTSSGTYTPTAGMKYCIVEVKGGGGGGGGSAACGATEVSIGGGGGAGGYARKLVNAATIGVSQVVTIGASGTGGGPGTATGGVGGATSVGAIISGNGGSGGMSSAAVASNFVTIGGTGGNGINGDINVRGDNGGLAWGFNSANLAIYGYGGGGVYGEQTIQNTGTGVSSANNYGGGGSGSSTSNSGPALTGGNGSTGVVIITEYIS